MNQLALIGDPPFSSSLPSTLLIEKREELRNSWRSLSLGCLFCWGLWAGRGPHCSATKKRTQPNKLNQWMNEAEALKREWNQQTNAKRQFKEINLLIEFEWSVSWFGWLNGAERRQTNETKLCWIGEAGQPNAPRSQLNEWLMKFNWWSSYGRQPIQIQLISSIKDKQKFIFSFSQSISLNWIGWNKRLL